MIYMTVHYNGSDSQAQDIIDIAEYHDGDWVGIEDEFVKVKIPDENQTAAFNKYFDRFSAVEID